MSTPTHRFETGKHIEFGNKLRSARKRTGKSQERIAAEVGTTRRNWVRWEMGHTMPSPDFMPKIGEATGQPDTFAVEETADDDEEAAPSVEFLDDLIAALTIARKRAKSSSQLVSA